MTGRLLEVCYVAFMHVGTRTVALLLPLSSPDGDGIEDSDAEPVSFGGHQLGHFSSHLHMFIGRIKNKVASSSSYATESA